MRALRYDMIQIFMSYDEHHMIHLSLMSHVIRALTLHDTYDIIYDVAIYLRMIPYVSWVKYDMNIIP